MNYRERFEATMQHKPVDRVPFDLAGTSLTGIEYPESIGKLRKHLGLPGSYTGTYPKFDEEILECFDIDFRRVGDILSPESPLTRRISDTAYTDCWGVTRVFTGLYWDIQQHPLKGAGIKDLDAFPWPRAEKLNMDEIKRFQEQAARLYEDTGYVVCAEHPVFGVLELGCWMCSFDEFLLKMAMEPEYVLRFFDKVLEYQKEVIEVYYGALGPYIHFTTSGDDFGTQTGPFMSPAMFAEMVMPYYKERIRYTKEFTRAYYFHHTCGSVHALIPHLIEAGVDILNPIQPGARDMEPEKLKKDFGDRITFWGGVDTQRLLPNGRPEEIRERVKELLEIMNVNGGYVLAPAHNIQPDVPSENLAAVFDGAREYYQEKRRP